MKSHPKHHDCHARPNEQHFRFQPTINPRSRQMARSRPAKQTANQQEQVRMEMEYK